MDNWLNIATLKTGRFSIEIEKEKKCNKNTISLLREQGEIDYEDSNFR